MEIIKTSCFIQMEKFKMKISIRKSESRQISLNRNNPPDCGDPGVLSYLLNKGESKFNSTPASWRPLWCHKNHFSQKGKSLFN